MDDHHASVFGLMLAFYTVPVLFLLLFLCSIASVLGFLHGGLGFERCFGSTPLAVAIDVLGAEASLEIFLAAVRNNIVIVLAV